ncbi:MAG: hypothetical protein KAW14_01825 [Candidatus Aegiribacteria sp.]|nr:hypothetical protein [Candidatus Aegiribacteria sp.]
MSALEPKNYDKCCPVFSLEKIQSGKYCLSSLNQESKAEFANAMYRRRTLTWSDLKRAQRHGLGTEKISITNIKTQIPSFITKDADDLLALRYHGNRGMIGFRRRDIFYVLWFDKDFTLYNHG